MNKIEYQMIEVLKRLKNDFGVFEIKAEFEAEGSRIDEMMRLKDVTSRVELPLLLKTGGVEAITDMYQGLALGVSGLNAPMAETPFALGKYLNSIKTFIPKDNADDISFSFNLETITAYNNLDAMLDLEDISLLDGMTIGRVDLTGSMYIGREAINTDKVTDICRTAFEKAKAKGLKNALGGGISTESIPIIESLNADDLLHKFETRKVVFPAEAVKYGEAAILAAVEFELLWLQSKRRYYSSITGEDETRIEMLSTRLNK